MADDSAAVDLDAKLRRAHADPGRRLTTEAAAVSEGWPIAVRGLPE
jgi:hypothetical protein